MNSNRVDFFDVPYDDTSQDWLTSGAKLAAFIKTHDEILSQAIKDALETPFNSSPYVLRNWGNEGFSDSYLPAAGDRPRLRIKGFMEEILGALRPFIRSPKPHATFVFPTLDTGTDEFTCRIELVMTDMQSTTYDHVVTWNATSKRASIV